MYRTRHFSLLLTLLVAVVGSCKDKELPPFSSDIEVNRWIEKEMKLWYYWEDRLPEAPNYQQDPTVFFRSLLYAFEPTSRPDGDRFSWIQQSADELKASLSGGIVSFGMEYRILSLPDYDQLMGSVLYVLPDSPADAAGIKRGDLFTHVNGARLNASNYQSLLTEPGEKTFTFTTVDQLGKTQQNSKEIRLTPIHLQEDPVHFYTVKTINNKKVGYLVYHQFYPSTNGTNDRKFDRKLERIFAEFKNQRINELVIDLRYNSGGYVSSAVHLASLIAPNVSNRDIFSIKEYNAVITQTLEKRYGSNFFVDRFYPQPSNIGDLLDRVYVLTSKRTASASELLINGLLPYMKVITVGETTVGKNVGSVTLSDTDKRTNWGLQPIVSKSFNSLKQSNYTAGFPPDHFVIEPLLLHAYGDERDPLLRVALEAIASQSSSRTSFDANRAFSEDTEALKTEELYVSFVRKTGENMLEDTLPSLFLDD